MTAVDDRPVARAIHGSSCVLVRKGNAVYVCQTPPSPDSYSRGAVVRCTCGRRYRTVLLGRDFGLAWRRRFLPWPRLPREGPS